MTQSHESDAAPAPTFPNDSANHAQSLAPIEPHTRGPVPTDGPKHRSPVWGWLAILVLLATAGTYVGLEVWVDWRQGDDWKDQTSPQVQKHLMEVIVILWFTFLGGCFGSFLNVVIYRLPAGRTLFGNSGCPRCGHAIRPQHNIPVIGWLFLQGRCFDCRAPIAPRYPLVELLVAGVFLAITFTEILPGGTNLPNFTRAPFPGVIGVVLAPKWDLLTIAIWHAAALTILISWAYIAYDGHTLPITYGASVLMTFSLLGFGFPHLVPIEPTTLPSWLGRAGMGIVVGIASWYVGSVRGRREPRRSLPSVVAGYILLALVFGGPATISIFLLEGFIRSCTFWLDPAGRLPWGLSLCLASLVHLALWKPLATGPWWPNPDTLSSCALGFVAAVALNVAFVRRNPV